MSALAAEGRKVVRSASGDGRVEDSYSALVWYKTIRLVTRDIGEMAVANVTLFSADVSSKACPCKTELDKCIVVSSIPPPL
jgi:hypothetical protein